MIKELLEIATQLKAATKEKSNETNNWKPDFITDYTVPQFNILISKKKKSSYNRFGKILAFIDSVKYIRRTDACTIMPIPTNSDSMKAICGSQQNASNLIKQMIEIGLVAIECYKFQFAARNEQYNKSKVYRYYYENEQLFMEYCRENNIEKFEVNNFNDKVKPKQKESYQAKAKGFDKEQVTIAPRLHINKPEEYSVSGFEELLTRILYEKYPQLARYQRLADMINHTYYKDLPEFQVKFKLHFEWNSNSQKRYIKSIGIRATNKLVNAKKEKDEKNEQGRKCRENILCQHKLNLQKDVSSSVPRVNLSINRGKWIPEDTDIYKLIYDEILKLEDHQAPKTDFETVRQVVKDLHMRAYFDRETTIGRNTRRAMRTVEDKEIVDITMKKLKQAVTEAEGGMLYGSLIFLHESCIYMDVLYSLLEDGYRVWQCYDAWYAGKDGVTQEEFEKYVTQLVEIKVNAYIAQYNPGNISVNANIGIAAA